MGHTYIGHNYTGHNCIGHNYVGKGLGSMFGMSKNELTGDVLMELFVKLDADGSGGISKDELRQGMVEPETHNSQLSRP